MIDARSRPQVASLYRLAFEPGQDAWMLLSPDTAVRLNVPAAEILRRCDGRHSVHQIVADLEQAFDRVALSGDVHAFLHQADECGWLAAETS